MDGAIALAMQTAQTALEEVRRLKKEIMELKSGLHEDREDYE